ncbi:HAD hydrolase family protein [Pasteurellaceae bacterium LIM206]|nr:HAD hydrolase family protein [Pasteurellaceae bacterium LIM206]
MVFSKNNLPMEFPLPTKINTLVCCDIDETYIPYTTEDKHKGGVEHLETFTLEQGNILAFGDSANDFAMFVKSGKGYLVSNADKTAIKTYGSSLNQPYCHGFSVFLRKFELLLLILLAVKGIDRSQCITNF